MKPSAPSSLPLSSLSLVLGVSVVWGLNFVMVKVALNQLPPLTLCALRFLLAFIPAIFIIPRPKIPWKYIIGYGLLTFAAQFALLFAGMAAGVGAGTAAIIVQLQVFFALFFACFIIKQKPNLAQIFGAIISFTGIALIGLHRDINCTWLGGGLILSAAVVWGLGNLISVKLKAVNMLSLVVWSSFIAFLPLLGLAFIFEQPLQIFHHQLTSSTWLAVAYITYASTYFGYGGWCWLLSKHPVATISPFALLAPMVAMLSSAFFLHETFEVWKIGASFLVIAGLGLNLFGQRLLQQFPSFKSEPSIQSNS